MLTLTVKVLEDEMDGDDDNNDDNHDFFFLSCDVLELDQLEDTASKNKRFLSFSLSHHSHPHQTPPTLNLVKRKSIFIACSQISL